MRYERNYLSQVILRIDFASLPALKTSARPALSNRIEALFPKLSLKPMAQISFNLGPGGAAMNQESLGMSYEHRRGDGATPVVTLTHDSLTFECSKEYSHFAQFRADADRIVGDFADLHPDAIVNRIGLRYINEIGIPEGNALQWDGLINAALVASTLAAIPVGMRVARSLHQLQTFTDDSTTVLMHYGLANPDYPNEVVRRQFVIDIDASRTGPFGVGQVVQSAQALNAHCESIFESSIADGLRNLMGVIDE